jgi:hypothetical protein
MEEPIVNGFNFSLINEYFVALERQGPGSPEATIKALGFVGNLSDQSRIADLGCGAGGQTMVLARQETFLKEHAGNKTAEAFVASMRREAELYAKYKQYYGYVFYIGKKL